MIRVRTSLAPVACGILLLACSQEPPVPAAPVAENSGEAEAAQGAPGASTPASTEAPVARVESLMITRPDDTPGSVLIMAAGTVASEGWSRPRLIPVETDSDPTTRTFNFVATSPGVDAPQPDNVPIEVRLEIGAFPPEVELVRIVAANNELTGFVGN